MQLEERVSRLEWRVDKIEGDVHEHDADIRKLDDWRSQMIGAARETVESVSKRMGLYGLTLTAVNIFLTYLVSRGGR